MAYEPHENPVVEEFRKHGSTASYHYADDSTSEWGAGKRAECKALELFDNNPELQNEMRVISSRFLWSLEMKRPSK